MTSPVISKTAEGVSGHLIYAGDGTYYFRVYADDGSFMDHAIFHSDLFITIKDPDAFFYSRDAGLYKSVLDHSPSTLGIDTDD